MQTTLAITPLAARLMAAHDARQAAAQPAPLPPPDDEWISTGKVAKMTGYSPRSIHRFCEQGFFVEGVDWKQRPALPGKSQGGFIYIKRSALKKLNGQSV